jgi:hypothetical protein
MISMYSQIALASDAHAGRRRPPGAVSVSTIGPDVPVTKLPVSHHISSTLAFGHAVARRPTEPARARAQPDETI